VSTTRRIRRNRIKTIALVLAAAAVASGPASAHVRDDGSSTTGTPVFAPITTPAEQYGGSGAYDAQVPQASLRESTLLPDGGNYDYRSDNSVAALARQTLEQQRVGVSTPDGFQPQLRGDTPLVIREAPDGYQPQLRGVEVSATASSGGIEWSDVGFGVTLAFVLAALSALMVIGVRNRTRVMHS
jgi:hypothetical protein